MSEPRPDRKPFVISKEMVWRAYKSVKANKGAPGIDDQSIADFEADLRANLYKLWNRMSSGSYFPQPVRAVPISKRDGKGSRMLDVPTVADRIAQTVVAMCLEPEVEPLFHPDSYGYRPARSALDALGVARQRCRRTDWVIDLDNRSFLRQRRSRSRSQSGGGAHESGRGRQPNRARAGSYQDPVTWSRRHEGRPRRPAVFHHVEHFAPVSKATEGGHCLEEQARRHFFEGKRLR